MKIYTVPLLICLFLSSCSESEENPAILGCGTESPIGLSQQTAEFNAQYNSISLSTKSANWWLSEIALEDNSFYDLTETNVTADSFQIKGSNFVFKRMSKTQLSISMPENLTENERTLTIYLQQANCFESIRITQSAN